jgi:hypothetical protein
MNTRDDAFEILPLDPDAWIHHETDDLAVARIGAALEHHRFSAVHPMHFVKKDRPAWFTEGTDALMVGRFVSHAGRQQNLPTLRFGNIAQLPWEPIKVEGRVSQESFLVEVHSLSGYSGSPVFAYHPRPSIETPMTDVRRRVPHFREAELRFLGVDWGHIMDCAPVLEKDKKTGRSVETDRWVKLNTGMAAVVPAWRLAELIEQEEVMEIRRQDEKEWLETQGSEEPAELDSAKPPEFSSEQFHADLERAIQPDDKPPKAGS